MRRPSRSSAPRDRIFAARGLDAVILAGADAVEHLFLPLRHLAGPEQSLICVLSGEPAGRTFRQRRDWADMLRRADEIWLTRADLAAPRGADVRLMPRHDGVDKHLTDWIWDRFDRIREGTVEKTRYGKDDFASIVLLAHNDGEYLKACIASVRRHTTGPREIIVVDNATDDGSTDFLAKEKDVRVLRSPKNIFFAGGCNAGIRLARGAYVVLLNADTVVTPGWLELMVRRLKRDRTFGAAGPYTNRAAGRQRVEKPGYKALSGLDAFARRWTKSHEGGRLDVPRLDGFCLVLKREVLQAVGLLDERFGPGGYEDYDLCLRMRQAGYRLVLAEEVYVHHHGGKGYRHTDYDAHRARNREIFVEKWCARSLDFLDEVW
jgi:GT2 family glycosyltransferase